jgi:hypothetical protein
MFELLMRLFLEGSGVESLQSLGKLPYPFLDALPEFRAATDAQVRSFTARGAFLRCDRDTDLYGEDS